MALPGKILLTPYIQDIRKINKHMLVVILSQSTSDVEASGSHTLGLTALDEVHPSCEPEDVEP